MYEMSRFSRKVFRGLNGCLLWSGVTTLDGYGQFMAQGKRVYAHRWVYEYYNGEIPQGMFIDHKCRTRNCVDPRHLRIVTPTQNVLENSDSVSAINKRKTHCIRGHNEWRVGKKGNRSCAVCGRLATNKWCKENRKSRTTHPRA
jgi:hypothetical protein